MSKGSATFIDLLILGRFQFLFGGILLYFLGSAVAIEMGASMDLQRMVFGYLVMAPAHLSVSYSNDLFDMKADKKNPGSMFTGGSGILKKRPELAVYAKKISISLILISILLSILFSFAYEITPFFILYVILGAMLGWFYSAPPLKLSYRGLGDISTAITVGVLVPLFGFFALTGSFAIDLLFLFFPMMLSGIVFVLIVQVPDLEADIRGNKNTWVMKIGRKWSLRLIFLSGLVSSIYYGLLMAIDISPGGMRILPFLIASIIPLIVALPGFIFLPEDRQSATKYVSLDMLALFAYLGSLDFFFFIIN